MSVTNRSDFQQVLSESLVATLRDPKHSVYIGINGTAPWTDEDIPPSPLDTPDQHESFWNHLVGFVKVDKSKIWSAIRHVRWIKGRTFEVANPALPSNKQTRFYCVNSIYEVFICTNVIGNTAVDYPTSQHEPRGHHNGKVIDSGDGYQWRYVYTVRPTDIENRVNDKWIPIYDGINDPIPEDQAKYGPANSSTYLNAKDFIVEYDLDKMSEFTADSYRQYGVFVDIINESDNKIATADVLTPAQVKSETGYLLFTQNIRKTDFEDNITDRLTIAIEV